MTVMQKIVELRKQYLANNGREANVVRVSVDDEYQLAGELPDPQKSDAFVKGVRAVVPTLAGLRVYWGAAVTEVDWEAPLPIMFGSGT